MNLVQKLAEAKIIQPPVWLTKNIHYLAITGSESYGCASDLSDKDIKGFFIPPKNVIFPHLNGKIPYFDWPSEQEMKDRHLWEKHHIEYGDKKYDIRLDSIVKLFKLLQDGNPDCIDLLFVPTTYVLHVTQVGTQVRENRHLFLSKLVWPKFKGYAYQQLRRMQKDKPEGKRVELIEKYGYDVKFAMHVVRLLNEVEQILTEQDLDIQRNREQLKYIRNGGWSYDDVIQYSNDKERELESILHQSSLPTKPDYLKIKRLLINCLEIHYESLNDCVKTNDFGPSLLNDMYTLLGSYQS